jgi:hypothetical protein
MSSKDCFSFHEGHHLHHTKVDLFDQNITPIDISHVMGSAFLVTSNGVTQFWFHHNPQRLLDALTLSENEGITATEDKKFLFVNTGIQVESFHMSQESISDCILLNDKSIKQPEVISIVKQLHQENIKKLNERGINA